MWVLIIFLNNSVCLERVCKHIMVTVLSVLNKSVHIVTTIGSKEVKSNSIGLQLFY